MRQELVLLNKLQALDRQCRDLEARQRRHPQIIAEARRELEAKQNAVEAQRLAAQSLQMAVDEKTLNLKEIEAKIAKITTQLNQTKTNKEYSALLSQKGAEEADKSRLEDEILALMGKVEDSKKDFHRGAQKFEQERKTHDESLRKAEEEQKTSLAQITELKAQRDQLRAQIPPEWVQPYERLLARRDGVALVGALRRVPEARSAELTEVWVCQGCYMNLTMQTITLLMTSDNPIFCKSCGRMLFLEGLPERVESKEGV
jgi:predicted  nucleic acid-binding Zn-ribbon protein